MTGDRSTNQSKKAKAPQTSQRPQGEGEMRAEERRGAKDGRSGRPIPTPDVIKIVLWFIRTKENNINQGRGRTNAYKNHPGVRIMRSLLTNRNPTNQGKTGSGGPGLRFRSQLSERLDANPLREVHLNNQNKTQKACEDALIWFYFYSIQRGEGGRG